jgi:NAD(P)-dependent dehydrogenase (short-subunit alcohol dehydrogenase family)
MAEELRPHGVASVALSPGWMRTELVLAVHGTDEAHWRERPELASTETPRYLGRAVVALAADPQVMARSGGVYRVTDLAAAYGFTDVDGRVPAGLRGAGGLTRGPTGRCAAGPPPVGWAHG